MTARILVIGDIMLDRYWFGDVSRLSQEAPVPVVKMGREDYRLGAAANVAANCAAMGAEVSLVGIIGQDDCEERVMELIRKANFNAYILTDPAIRTTQKLRVIGRSQQMVRVDFESRPTTSINWKARELIAEHDIIVFSDYGKGALADIAELIAEARRLKKTVLIDPKGFDYGKYRGADLIKPNLDEMREMAGGWASEAELQKKAERMCREGDIAALLLTRAADGMTLFFMGATHIQAKAIEVYDVTGAGDTVMAATAVELAKGRTLLEAVTVANHAAAVAVQHFGTHAVTKQELEEACAH